MFPGSSVPNQTNSMKDLTKTVFLRSILVSVLISASLVLCDAYESGGVVVLAVGCTGSTGTRALRGLLDAGLEPSQIRILTRDAERPFCSALRSAGFGLVEGDLDDPKSLVELKRVVSDDAVAGLYVHSTSSDTKRLDRGEVERARTLAVALVDATTTANDEHDLRRRRRRRPHVVYNSAAGESGHGVERVRQKHDVERVFSEVFGDRATFTSLRANLFCEELWKHYTRPSVLDKGDFPFSTSSDRPIHLTSVRDVGRLAGIRVLRRTSDDDEVANVRVLNVAGDVCTPAQIAEAFAEAQGSPCRHRRNVVLAILARLFFRDLWQIMRFYQRSTETTSVEDLRREFPNALTSFPEFLRETEWGNRDRTYEDFSDVARELREHVSVQ